ncbi:MAG: hypothetical protein VXB01_16455, partial [Opitutae bacterium]
MKMNQFLPPAIFRLGLSLFGAPAQIKAQTNISTTEVYNTGLVATIYIEDKGTQHRARDQPSGIAIGSYIDAHPPIFGYSSLKQDDGAINYLAGSRIGL